MGSGSKFNISRIHDGGVGLGIFIGTFPHRFSIDIMLITHTIYIGFGKGYDE